MYGGGAEAVGGKHGTDGIAAGKYHQGKVGAVGLFDACAGGEELDAVDVQQLVCGFFCEVDCHFAAPLFGVAMGLGFRRPFWFIGGRLKSVQNPNTGMIIGAMAAVSTPLRVSPSPAYAAMRRLRSSEAAMPMACEAVPSDMPTDEGMPTVFLSTV